MTPITLLLLARVLHILSSTLWAGFVIIAGLTLMTGPRDLSAAEARRMRRDTIGRAAQVVAPSAVVSLLSGLYLFGTVHAGQHTPTEIALGIGALAAVASFFVGAIGSGGPERQLAKLDKLSNRSSSETATTQALDRRVLITGRATAALLLVAVVSMAVARFL
jgi:hypothetical protein